MILPFLSIPCLLLVLVTLSVIKEKKIKNYDIFDVNSGSEKKNNDNNVANNEKIEVIRKAISNDNINKDSNLEELNNINSKQNENKIKYDHFKNEPINNSNKNDLIQIRQSNYNEDEERKKNSNKQIQSNSVLTDLCKQLLGGQVIETDRENIIIKDIHGKKIYEGKHKYGTPNGYGKLFDEEDNIVYEGNFYSGVAQGNGILYKNGVKDFEGNFSNNNKSGQGKEYYASGLLKFEGSYLGNLRNGQGTEYYDQYGEIQCKQQGTWKDGDIDPTKKLTKWNTEGTKLFEGFGTYINENDKPDNNMTCKTYYPSGRQKFIGKMNNFKPWEGLYYEDYDEAPQKRIICGDVDDNYNENYYYDIEDDSEENEYQSQELSENNNKGKRKERKLSNISEEKESRKNNNETSNSMNYEKALIDIFS